MQFPDDILIRIIIFVLGLCGFWVARRIHKHKKANKILVCPVGFDCHAVIHSNYSEFMHVPLEIFGMIYYAFLSIFYLFSTDNFWSFSFFNLSSWGTNFYIKKRMLLVHSLRSYLSLYFSFFYFWCINTNTHGAYGVMVSTRACGALSQGSNPCRHPKLST